jgi:hypothetical protein
LKKKALLMTILSIVLTSVMFIECSIANPLVNLMENANASTSTPSATITSIKPPPPNGVVQIYDPNGKPPEWKTVTKEDLETKKTIDVPSGATVKTGANTTVEVTCKGENKTNIRKIGPDNEVTFIWKSQQLLGPGGMPIFTGFAWEIGDKREEEMGWAIIGIGLGLITAPLDLTVGVALTIVSGGATIFGILRTHSYEVTVYNDSVYVLTTNVNTNETIGFQTVNGSLWFDGNEKPWSSAQQVMVNDNGTISEPIEVLLDATGLGMTPYGSDSQGLPTAHYPNEDVYVSGYAALLPPNASIPVYLIPESLEPLSYNPAVAKASGIALMDNWGNLPETFLWNPETSDVGLYSIWVDTDNSSSCTEGDIVNYIGVPVIMPEEPSVGGIWVPVDNSGLLAPYIGLASTAMIGAVATVFYVKRGKRRKEKQ